MGLDPGTEILKIFCETCNKDLRDYLGNHLISIQKIEEKTLQSWALLNSILNDNDTHNSVREQLENLNINTIIQQSSDWQSKLGSELFFKLFGKFSLQIANWLKIVLFLLYRFISGTVFKTQIHVGFTTETKQNQYY